MKPNPSRPKPMNLKTIIEETQAMIAAGEVEDSIRFSGEELARADSRWRHAHNDRMPYSEIIECLRSVLTLSVLHCGALRLANQSAEALGTGLGALMSVAFEDAVAPLAREVMIVVDGCLADLEEYVSRLIPDEILTEHARVMTRYLISIEYSLYEILKDQDGPAVNTAYLRLKNLLGLVQSPTVSTPYGPVDPMHPLPIMNDLLGRARVILGDDI